MSSDKISPSAPRTEYWVLWGLSGAHLLNDTFQSVIPSLLPLLQETFVLSFFQIGLITAVFQAASSICQPLVGWYADKHPIPYSLPCGMLSTLLGVLMLAYSATFSMVLFSVVFFGFGSAVLHPEANRLTAMAAGKRRGFAQSVFQAGGNTGSAVGPLLVALVVYSHGIGHQHNIAWLSLFVLAAVLWNVPLARWYAQRVGSPGYEKHRQTIRESGPNISTAKIAGVFTVLLILVFSKNVYTISISNFLPFYLHDHYGTEFVHTQYFLFAFLFAIAAGTFVGGPIGDKFGRRRVIWFSILGAAPFAMLMPHIHSLWGTCILSMFTGFIMASSFPAIITYAQELVPGRVGTVGGLFFGFSFGAGAIGSAGLGRLADDTSISFIYTVCAYLPLIGLLVWFLPKVKQTAAAQ